MSGSNVVATGPRPLDPIGLADPNSSESGGTDTGMRTTSNQQAAEQIRAALSQLIALERELTDVRAALLAAETLALAIAPEHGAPTAYTVEQVADQLGLSRSTVFEMIKRSEIRSHRIGGLRRIFRADLEAYVASVRGEAA